jgi:hypothetical protein
MGRFKKGLCLGALLGAGLTWMSTTKKGRETREQMLNASADIYEELKEKVIVSGALDKMTKTKYYALVDAAVEKYAKKNKLTGNIASMAKKVVETQWITLQKELKKKK